MGFPNKLPFILDGGTGTNLIAAGMPSGVCVEQWILEHPAVLSDLQRSFLAAGSDAVLAPTFGANRAKLKDYGLQEQVEEINLRLVALSKNVAASTGALVGGDMSPTGLLVEPYGDSTFEQVYETYLEQARALKKAGVDFIALETQMTLSDLRAGVLAAREVGLPVFASLTVEPNGRTFMGTKFLSALITLQAMGACAVGLNCSTGPEVMKKLLPEVAPHACVPLIAKPNAGKPSAEDPTRYELSPELFAEDMRLLLQSGARIVGGCCGTGAEHIAALKKVVDEFTPPAPSAQPDCRAAATEGDCFFLGDDINLSEPIACSYDLADDLIDVEDEPINVAVVTVQNEDDAAILAENAGMARLPLMVSADNAQALECALRRFQGRLLVNSRCEIPFGELNAIAQKYGAIVF
ncbi:MAG TPA: homocysteine S-methyltransferase family protein [Candidatus Gallacutalibacter stercoravium]|nr:homocysteine S-methyltransferase family protein [Candidatus Gallacutalibacter stercoravium]